MSATQRITGNIQPPNKDLELLKQHFPNCFDKNGAFGFEKFKSQLSKNEINFSKESYGMDWLGKSYARLLATDEATTLLKEDETLNKKEENATSENLLIKGDNLEVLKHLSNAYYEKIKMIYIDPPYNTGSDGFVYADDRKFTVDELQELSGVSEERAKRILDFTQSKSNSHSAWLTFMYPRLYIAKQLLKDDGVIFISIDDNEVAQLKLLLDDIFGEENFVGELVIQTATDNNKTQINVEHEYILTFAKSKELQPNWFGESEPARLILEKYESLKNKHPNQDDLQIIQKKLRSWIRQNKKKLPKVSHYDNVDLKGVFHDGDVANTKLGGYNYDVLHPITKKICKVPDKGFRYPESTLNEMIENDDVLFGKDENTLIKPKKRLENTRDILRSIIYEDGRSSTKYVDNLIGKGIFNNPKSHSILKRLLGFLSNEKNELILDFFAGSGTTGDAVMQLNAEDGGNRKFILAQLPELIDPKNNKTAYNFVKNELKVETPTIFDITKERLIRASKKINNELDKKTKNLELKIKHLTTELQTEETLAEIKTLEDQITKNSKLKTQNYFKVFETMPIWEDYYFEAEELSTQTNLFDESKLTSDDVNALLVTWKTYDGIPLSRKLTKTDLNGYTAHYSNEKLYLMNKGFNTGNLKALLEKIDNDKRFNPTIIIAFGYHFESKSLREISENIKSYANKKSIDVDFIMRY